MTTDRILADAVREARSFLDRQASRLATLKGPLLAGDPADTGEAARHLLVAADAIALAQGSLDRAVALISRDPGKPSRHLS